MAFCTYAEGSAVLGATAVSNMFLLEYMPQAPGEYVKVYLYALLLCRYPDLSADIEAMADALHLDTDTVHNAFKYWKREGLIEQLSDHPPAFALLPLTLNGSPSESDAVIYENRSYNMRLQALMPGLVLEAHELRMAADWLDVMKLTPEAVYLMVSREVDKRGGKLPTARTMFRYLDKTAREWAQAGVSDEASAQEYLQRSGVYGSLASQVLRRFGQSRKPSEDELALVKKWLDEWELDAETVLAACAETVKGTNPSFGYLDGIFSRRREGADDESYRRVKVLLGHLGLSVRPTREQLDALGRFLAMGFAFDAVEQAAIQCGESNRRTFEDIEKRLLRWKEAGAFTVEEIRIQRAEQKRYQDFMSEVFERAGVTRRVSASDIKFAKVWTALISSEAVMYAAECARGTESPVQYMDKLVRIWSAQGLTTLEQVQTQSESGIAGHRGTRTGKKPMDERTVTEDEFETGFYADIMNRKRAGE